MAKHRSNQSLEYSRRVQRAFGARLQQARTSATFSQEALAKELGVTRTTISNMEKGNHRVFLDHVFLASRALRVPIISLLPDEREVSHAATIHLAADSGIDSTQIAGLVEHARGVHARAASKERREAAKRRGGG